MESRTKIVATYGPAMEPGDILASAIRAGVDVVRLNFSHGDFDSHATAIDRIRTVSREVGITVAILLDLRGPKVRVGDIGPGCVTLTPGATVRVIPAAASRDPAVLPVDGITGLLDDIKPGERILLADGAMRLVVERVQSSGDAAGAECRIEIGGAIASRKGVNFPDSALRSLETITEKDCRDLAFGIQHGVDFIALSFVREAGDVRRLRALARENGATSIPIIAKIEKREALRDLAQIVAEADGVMVARGDLGVETPLEEVALRQKEIIRECRRQGKISITATQMLESMIQNPSPTRAEVADVSNAVFDGTDAVMLSGETAIGAYPVEAVAMMARIAGRTEEGIEGFPDPPRAPALDDISDSIAHAAASIARQIGASAIVCFTQTGLTARLISRYRPTVPVLGVSPEPATVRRLCTVWGVRPVELKEAESDAGLHASALKVLTEQGHLEVGQMVVVAAGVSTGPLGKQTNLLRVEILE
jgi:pyruvate kinase